MSTQSTEDLVKENQELKELLSNIYDSVWIFGLDKTSTSVTYQMKEIKVILEKQQ